LSFTGPASNYFVNDNRYKLSHIKKSRDHSPLAWFILRFRSTIIYCSFKSWSSGLWCRIFM